MLTTGFSHLSLSIYIIYNESHYFPVLICICVCVCFLRDSQYFVFFKYVCVSVLLENFYFIRNRRKMELPHWRYENTHMFFIPPLRLSRKQVIIAIDYHACVKERISRIVFSLITGRETSSTLLTGSECLHSFVVFHLQCTLKSPSSQISRHENISLILITFFLLLRFLIKNMKAQKKAIRKENQSLQRITCRCFSQDATYRPSGCHATEVTIVLDK